VRIFQFLGFIGTVSAIVAVVHVYFWFRLVRTPDWPAPWRGRATWTLVALAASVPVAMLVVRPCPRWISAPVSGVGFVWLAATFYLLLSLLLLEPVRLAARTSETARVLAAAAVGVTTLVCGWGLVEASLEPRVERVTLPVRRLDPRLAGLRIVMISDLHVGPHVGRSFMERVVALVNAERPDVVAITGDLVDGPIERLAPDVEPLRRLTAPLGVFFVLGNHEGYSGAEDWAAHVASLGIRVLRDERTTVSRDGGELDVAGVDDPAVPPRDGRRGLDAALSGRDESRPVVVLAHRPEVVHDAERLGVDVVLASHTHGGQLWPFGLFERGVHPLVAGLGRFGPTWLYVGRGTAEWGPPMRVATPAEITVVTLQSGN
jgi:predicted MPP superfamily phosphohydrolase